MLEEDLAEEELEEVFELVELDEDEVVVKRELIVEEPVIPARFNEGTQRGEVQPTTKATAAKVRRPIQSPRKGFREETTVILERERGSICSK